MDWLFRYADPSIDWGYAMITLVVRFIGVFIVMAVMQVALQVASRVVGRVEKRATAPGGATAAASPAVTMDAMPEEEVAVGDGTAAAIGLALSLESRAAVGAPGSTSPWGIAGRLQQLHRQPRG